MSRKDLVKNRLDLEYHSESLKASIYLILLTIGFLSFIGSFLFLRDNKLLISGLIITLSIFIFALIIYRKTSKRMREILLEIENLYK